MAEETVKPQIKAYFMGGSGIEKPLDFEGNEIKEGNVLTFDNFDPSFDSKAFYKNHYPDWTPEMIEIRNHQPCFVVKYNPDGYFYANGIKQNLYLHDFRFKYTKIVKIETPITAKNDKD